jgi:tRNA(fMet)-specific endonuclease VapC
VSLRYVLDTNVLSEQLIAHPTAHLTELLRRHDGLTATCAPVFAELVFGAKRLPESRRRSEIERYIFNVVSALPVLPYDSQAAAWHGAERARLERRGRMPSFVDGQIAAIAVVNDLTLVTRNVRDFAGFDNLRVENWFR